MLMMLAKTLQFSHILHATNLILREHLLHNKVNIHIHFMNLNFQNYIFNLLPR